MIVCINLPRFELAVAAGGPLALAGRPLAIASFAAGQPRVGEVSGAAEAFGVSAGMALGEALTRCPELSLLPSDPLRVAQAWEEAVSALEGIGAAPELERPGLLYFESDGLRGLHGAEQWVIATARRALGRPARVGAASTRFCALAAALAARTRRAVVVGEQDTRCYLAAQPLALLGHRTETAALVEPLDRLGLKTLGALAALKRDVVADRFGEPGTWAWRLARGEDKPLCARSIEDRLEEGLKLGESSSGPALERVLGVLIDRLLARPERRGRTLRAVTLSARLVEGGTWQERVVFRQALSDRRRMGLALSLRLALLPAPAEALRLAVERFGPPEGEQGSLLRESQTVRRERLREAVGQVRTVAGPEAALHAVCVDPESRVPERRVVLTPFPG